MKHLLALAALAVLVPAGMAANPIVEMKTSKGTIKIELFEDKAPVTVKNFLKYVDDKHFDSTVFHRVISDFMIQGGGFTKDMKQKTTRAAIKNESKNGLANDRGTIAMARTSDPDRATAQFYINTVNNKGLNRKSDKEPGYCVFGKVISGMDVVDKIRAVETGRKGGHANVPLDPITIESVRKVGKSTEP